MKINKSPAMKYLIVLFFTFFSCNNKDSLHLKQPIIETYGDPLEFKETPEYYTLIYKPGEFSYFIQMSEGIKEIINKETGSPPTTTIEKESDAFKLNDYYEWKESRYRVTLESRAIDSDNNKYIVKVLVEKK